MAGVTQGAVVSSAQGLPALEIQLSCDFPMDHLIILLENKSLTAAIYRNPTYIPNICNPFLIDAMAILKLSYLSTGCTLEKAQL